MPRWLQAVLVGVIGAASIALIVFSSAHVATHGPPPGMQKLAHDRMRAEIERGIAASPDSAWFAQKFKQNFPEDYEQMIEGIVAKAQTQTPTAEMGFTYGQAFMGEFFLRNREHSIHASPDILARMGSQYAVLIKAIGAENVPACAEFFTKGEVSPENGLKLSPNAKHELQQASSLMLDAILSGKTTPADNPPVDVAGWQAMAKALDTRGVKLEQVAAIGTPEGADLTDADVCRLGSAFLISIGDMPPALRAQLVAELLRAA